MAGTIIGSPTRTQDSMTRFIGTVSRRDYWTTDGHVSVYHFLRLPHNIDELCCYSRSREYPDTDIQQQAAEARQQQCPGSDEFETHRYLSSWISMFLGPPPLLGRQWFSILLRLTADLSKNSLDVLADLVLQIPGQSLPIRHFLWLYSKDHDVVGTFSHTARQLKCIQQIAFVQRVTRLGSG